MLFRILTSDRDDLLDKVPLLLLVQLLQSEVLLAQRLEGFSGEYGTRFLGSEVNIFLLVTNEASLL